MSLLVSGIAIGVALVVLVRGRDEANQGTSSKPRSGEPSPAPMQPSLTPDPDAEPDGSLRLDGRVVGVDGHGIADADVWIDSVPTRSTKTEANGAFVFDRLISRTYSVGAKSGELIGGPQAMRLAARDEAVVIRLREGAHVHVAVVDVANAPIPNARLRVITDGTTASTDDKGEARLSVNPGWVGIEASAPELASRRITTIVGSAGAIGRITIVLAKGFSVAGRVVDERGKGIANARVFALQSGSRSNGDANESAITDPDGSFTILAVAGLHSFLAIDGEHATGRTPDFDVDRAVTGIEIAMTPGAVYAGGVVDAHGTPVPHASVHVDMQGSVEPRQVTCSADGAFEIRGLRRAAYVAYAESDAGVSKETVIDLTNVSELRDHRLLLELVTEPNPAIAGLVIDDTGAPVDDVTVNARMRERVSAVMSSARTDSRGGFSIANLPRGEYSLWAGSSAKQARDDSATVASTGDKNVRVVISRTGVVTGKVVVAQTSTPVKWFSVDLRDPRYLHEWTTPGNDGVFEIRDVTPSTFTLTLKGPEFADTTKANVQVEPGKTTDVGTIVVQRGRRVTGKVVDSAGHPVAEAKVILGYGGIFPDGSFDERLIGVRSALTDRNGAFSIVGVSAKTTLGPSKLVAAADHPLHGRSLAVAISEGVGDPPAITLVLRASGSIAGRVTQGGRPVAHALVGAGWPELGMATTTEEGAFVIAKLPEGAIVLRTMLPAESMRPYSTSIAVVAGKQTSVTIDVPVGALTLIVNVRPRDGQKVTAAMVFLFAGTVAGETYKQVAAQVFVASQGIGRWLGGTSPPPRFGRLVPGEYTVCTVPLAENPADQGFMERVRENGEAVKAYCTPTRIASAPEEQEIAVEVPSMLSLPALK